ncbi:hypothetical protein AB0E69_14705 [Kribbella sp. NPDC026611]|uniref:hypothetical protein n=1 Tax=Kribbella sp. NPDC026611 TaxID=3154911 RepID=UPI003411B3F1
MSLPPPARERLAANLRAAIEQQWTLRESHTIPVNRQSWSAHSASLKGSILGFIGQILRWPGDAAPYAAQRDWIEGVLLQRGDVLSRLLSLQPFEPFKEEDASAILEGMQICLKDAMAAVMRSGQVVAGENVAPDGIRILREIGAAWTVDAGYEYDKAVQVAFGMDSPPLDQLGDFRPSLVFQFYGYRNSLLLQRLFSHLASLGVPPVTDVLACVWIVGSVVNAHDQVMAYASMDSMIIRFLESPKSIAEQVLEHLESRARALRHTHLRVLRALYSIENEEDREVRALGLAEVYKRLVEGPVRQYGWAMRCLREQTWSEPPTTSPLREAMIAQGGWIAQTAEILLLPQLRNSEAHETLEWDGYRGVLVAEGEDVDPARVAFATAEASSFALGCEAGLTCYRALDLVASAEPPGVDDKRRMPAWLRAEAFFGTNRLEIMKASFNAATATIEIAKLENADINPCFQALLLARRVLPEVRIFEVAVVGAIQPMISLSASDLDRGMPVWDRAIGRLSSIPLSTFLPINLAARLARESMIKAVRAVSWIVIDDALGALDGSPPRWTPAVQELVNVRIELAVFALEVCVDSVPVESRVRINVTLAALRELRDDLAQLGAHAQPELIDSLGSVGRLRHFWDTWGPVERLPGITPDKRGQSDVDRQPQLIEPPDDMRWRTL